MVFADVDQFERRTAQSDGSFAVDHLIRYDHVRTLQRDDSCLGIPVGYEDRAQILEWLAASDVIEMAVAVDHVFDRRLGDLPDFLDIGLCRRPPQSNWIGGD